ncbi:cysteine desulfurase [candidate division CPR3 bacterium 4484_211]|uniref:cysteine desulfurase n=1 Tax=candidate division CPR3 bacterium 4484_211 TaxID=1968527 RepID=A0A1W9NYU3_UNCC3|nr:MAG: cysteine desulfurase [candidate division CPR3 bacterium 4484_211]
MFDVQKFRKDFPILSREVRGRPLAYLDNAATTQKPRSVIRSVSRFYQKCNANIHRGIHSLSEEATLAYEKARKKTAQFIGADDAREIIFVRNTTEAINLVAFSWGKRFFKDGDAVVLTEMEHHANIIPWLILSQEKHLNIKYARIDSQGYLDLNHLWGLLDAHPSLLSLTHVSNVLGTINPLGQIIKRAHEKGVLVLVDAAQSVGHLGFNVKKYRADFLAFSGHKMLGPTGIGVLWAKREHLEKMMPFLGGGGMIDEVYWQRFTPNRCPEKFEAGTPNIAGAVGLGAAIDYLDFVGLERIYKYEEELTSYALQKLTRLDGLKIIGPENSVDRGALISFSLAGIHPHDLATILDEQGIAIRSGHHCAMPLHQKLGIPASARASFCFYNTKKEIDRLIEGIRKARQLLDR